MMNKNDEPVMVEQAFNASIESVWTAITDIDQMRQWYFENIPDFKPEVGFETRFEVQSGDRTFPHRWKVTEVKPFEKISYNWKYDCYSGDSFVVFELLRQNSRTLLRLTHQVTESFPGNIPEFSKESCTAGWTYFIKDCLKKFLGNRAR
jgi:uncharacterized protein YndB with AHSA1/START domain